jgi:hypothetical protein
MGTKPEIQSLRALFFMRTVGIPSIYPLHTLTDCTSSSAMNTNAQFCLIHNHSSWAAFCGEQAASRDIELNPCVDSMEEVVGMDSVLRPAITASAEFPIAHLIFC